MIPAMFGNLTDAGSQNAVWRLKVRFRRITKNAVMYKANRLHVALRLLSNTEITEDIDMW